MVEIVTYHSASGAQISWRSPRIDSNLLLSISKVVRLGLEPGFPWLIESGGWWKAIIARTHGCAQVFCGHGECRVVQYKDFRRDLCCSGIVGKVA